MARCGCSSDACACVVNGGGLTTSSGTGTPNNPYVLTTTCESVRTCFTAGDGIDITDGVISADPLDCADVRACFIGGDSIDLDVTTGQIDLCLSTDAGNAATLGTDGCLFVPPGGGTATVLADGNGTQLTGTGVVGDPFVVNVVPGCGITATADGVEANVQAWPYPCDQTANQGGIYCDPATGELGGEPKPMAGYRENNVGAGTNVVLTPGGDPRCATSLLTITNDSCEEIAVTVSVLTGSPAFLPSGDREMSTTLELTTDGVTFGGPILVYRYENHTPDDMNFATEAVNRQFLIAIAPGQTRTFGGRVCQVNNGPLNVQSEGIRINVSASYATRNEV